MFNQYDELKFVIRRGCGAFECAQLPSLMGNLILAADSRSPIPARH